jgi:mono/diheme cytochrome c family protein
MKTLWSRLLTAETGVLLLVGTFALAAAFASNGAVPQDPSPEARGQQIFQREGCVFCHSLPGYQPTPQAVMRGLGYLQRLGTGWSRNGPDLALEPGKRTDDWHLAHLLNPTAVLPGCPMPSYTGLPDDELRALIAFLQTPRSLTPTPSPGPPVNRGQGEKVPPTRTSYLAGRELYRLYCAGCHGMEGNGAGPVGHLLWPEPRDFTDTAWMRKRSDAYLLEVIGRGKPGTAMPGYDDLLTAREQALVLYYLKLYTNPSARQSLEEGFVAEEGKR